MVLVLAALGMEVRPLRRKLRQMPVNRSGKGLCGDEVAVALTGIGPTASQATAEKLLNRHKVSIAISTGFAGALAPDVEAGQLFASDVIHAPNSPSLRPDGFLLVRARAIGGEALRVGASVTVPSAASHRSVREELRISHRAEIVDMESYWVAGAAMRRGIPCLVIRAVSDTLKQELPSFNARGDTPASGFLAVLGAFLRSPRSLGLVPALWRQSHLAAARLADFLGRFLREAGLEELSLP